MKVSRLQLTTLLCGLFAYIWMAVSVEVDLVHFLNSVPSAGQAEMEAILSNTSLTKAEVEEKLDAWAARQPGTFPEEYLEVKSLLNDPKKNPGDSDEITRIHQNKSITREQERTAILQILSRDAAQRAAALHDDSHEIPEAEVESD